MTRTERENAGKYEPPRVNGQLDKASIPDAIKLYLDILATLNNAIDKIARAAEGQK